jgi:RNA polymerase sigma factor (TIGR02999 family)
LSASIPAVPFPGGSGYDGAVSDLDRAVPELYQELRRLAAQLMRNQRPGHILQPTALVHEAYLKLAGRPDIHCDDRKQFLALAARAMRQVLVDSARARASGKRGGDPVRITLGGAVAGSDARAFDLVSLGEALERLEKIDGRQVRIVELRYLAGMTVEEAADELSLSPTQVKREAAMARAWLIRELG